MIFFVFFRSASPALEWTMAGGSPAPPPHQPTPAFYQTTKDLHIQIMPTSFFHPRATAALAVQCAQLEWLTLTRKDSGKSPSRPQKEKEARGLRFPKDIERDVQVQLGTYPWPWRFFCLWKRHKRRGPEWDQLSFQKWHQSKVPMCLSLGMWCLWCMRIWWMRRQI